MNNNGNVYIVTVSFMHFINDNISMYDAFCKTWVSVGNHDAAYERQCKKLAFVIISDDIDSIIHHYYPNVRIIDQLHCESFIWSIQRRLSLHIDGLTAYGYDYVMHSYKLRAEYQAFVTAYEYLHKLCERYNVFDGNMH